MISIQLYSAEKKYLALSPMQNLNQYFEKQTATDSKFLYRWLYLFIY